MTCQLVLPACLLLLWTLTAPVSCNIDFEINVADVPDGIKLSCANGYFKTKGDGIKSFDLEYKDESTGEYMCVQSDSGTEVVLAKIYVKFRSCDNCVELDMASITGIVVGDVVATIVIGVAVYLLVSQTQIRPVTSHKKSSDRQHLVPNERIRAPNDLYQPLKGRQKETYDVLNRK